MKIDLKGKVNSSVLASIILAFAIVLLLALTILNVLGIRTLAQQKQEEARQLEINRQNLAYLGDLEKQSAGLEKELENSKLLLPLGPSQDDIIYRFNELEAKYPGQILNLVFEDVKNAEGANNNLPFKAVYKGNYGDFITILYDMSTWSRMVFVDDLTVKSEDSAGGLITGTILGKAFYR